MALSPSMKSYAPNTHLLEIRARRAIRRGEPIPLDVAAGLMEAGFDVQMLEYELETLH